MSKTYIVYLPERYIEKRQDGEEWLQMPVNVSGHELMIKTVIPLTPYTDLDMEQVRKEAYDKGYQDANVKIGSNEQAIAEKAYQHGLVDAWNAARKIACDRPHGGFCIGTKQHIFGAADYAYILANYNASEAVERIRQHEQEQEEIKVGDEVKSGDERYIVLQKYLNNIDELMVILFNRRDGQIGKWHVYNANGAIFEKTGNRFPEIAEVLKKMQEETA